MSRGAAHHALRWPLWSWRNLTISTVVVLALMALLGRLSDTGSPASAARTPAAEPQAAPTLSGQRIVPAPSSPTTATATTEAAPSTGRATATSPVNVATGFVTAWSNTSNGHHAWVAAMKPWATPDLLASLQGTDPAQVPASRVTGDAALRSTSGTTAVVTVPTDGGRVAITLTKSGGRWHAAALAPDEAPPGAPTPSLGQGAAGTGE